MDFLKIDPGLMIWTWVCFGILFFILARFAIPNVIKGLETREATIKKSLDDAALVEKRLGEIDAEHAAMLQKARHEADELILQARKDAESVRLGLLAKAEQEAEAVVALARERAREERTFMLEALRGELADFVCDSSEKVIGQTFVGDRDRAWARELAGKL